MQRLTEGKFLWYCGF